MSSWQAMRRRDADDLALVGRARLAAVRARERYGQEWTSGHDLPGPAADDDTAVRGISQEEVESLVFVLGSGLSSLEAGALRLYLEGHSYNEMAKKLGCDTKAIDNALQRVKRKILRHQRARQPAKSDASNTPFLQEAAHALVQIDVWSSKAIDELALSNALDDFIRHEGFVLTDPDPALINAE